ncbi:MAG: low-density lipoprotein receptor class A repeat-containing protein, partial [Candidatus Thermoplasmatota archaeon]|nr:low-density lipoprotein receptor class A repeat-containing protein [Candidatus Thermoplasmatota archaeon]
PNGIDEPTYDATGTETSQFECAVFEDPEEEELTDIPLSSVNDGVIDCDLRQDEAALSGNYTDRWFGEVHWESYEGGYCEWEGTGQDDDRWWCKIDETDDQWEEWWFYCENHGADWHCTDYFGQSDSHQNSADGQRWSGNDNSSEVCLYYGEDFDIPWSWVNDGIVDCDVGTDEPSYDANGQENSTILCYDGTEILLSKANDGQNDCSEGEDEYSWVLESRYTCDDGSDEPEYELEELTDFTCDDGTLVPLSKVNNHENDCSEGEDEPTYEQTEYSTFVCNSGDTIPLSSVNDGQNDCPGGDDEPTYSPVTQTETSTYSCLYSGETIALSSVNNGEEDCDDGTDEPHYYEEETSEFICNDGYTLPLSYVNDGHEDCMDGSDEPQYVMPE